jgi:hypothetical protein
MPPPPRTGGPPVTNIRNTSSLLLPVQQVANDGLEVGAIWVRFPPSQPEPAAEVVHYQIDILVIVARDD